MRSGLIFDIGRLAPDHGPSAADFRGFSLGRGESIAIIGGNGAGKTTLVESLIGLRKAHVEGWAFGQPWQDWARNTSEKSKLGAQLQNVSYLNASKVSDLLHLHRVLFLRQCPDIAKALGIGSLTRKKCSQLSKGERQRVDLYLALAHHPELAILDEPFSGLDVRYQNELLDILGKRLGALIMICHSAKELAIVDTVCWVDAGKIRESGKLDQIKRKLVADSRIDITMQDQANADALVKEIHSATRSQAGTSPAVLRIDSETDGRIVIYGDETLESLAKGLLGSYAMNSIAYAKTTLDDLLTHCTKVVTA